MKSLVSTPGGKDFCPMDADEPVVMVCSIGCCPGCQDCYGMSIGCHQDPCRCGEPCTCRYANEDADPKWRNGCVRHDDSDDQRNWQYEEDEWDETEELVDREMERFSGTTPCVICHELGPCAFDADGLPLIHLPPLEGSAETLVINLDMGAAR